VFDFRNYLQIQSIENKSEKTWKCPVCKRKAVKIYIDGFLKNIIDKYPDEYEIRVFNKDFKYEFINFTSTNISHNNVNNTANNTCSNENNHNNHNNNTNSQSNLNIPLLTQVKSETYESNDKKLDFIILDEIDEEDEILNDSIVADINNIISNTNTYHLKFNILTIFRQ